MNKGTTSSSRLICATTPRPTDKRVDHDLKSASPTKLCRPNLQLRMGHRRSSAC
ncbi:MAG: hypothetical protein VB143_08725 [Burkholderia sp.]